MENNNFTEMKEIASQLTALLPTWKVQWIYNDVVVTPSIKIILNKGFEHLEIIALKHEKAVETKVKEDFQIEFTSNFKTYHASTETLISKIKEITA